MRRQRRVWQICDDASCLTASRILDKRVLREERALGDSYRSILAPMRFGDLSLDRIGALSRRIVTDKHSAYLCSYVSSVRRARGR